MSDHRPRVTFIPPEEMPSDPRGSAPDVYVPAGGTYECCNGFSVGPIVGVAGAVTTHWCTTCGKQIALAT